MFYINNLYTYWTRPHFWSTTISSLWLITYALSKQTQVLQIPSQVAGKLKKYISKKSALLIFGAKYSRMDQVNLREIAFKKFEGIWSAEADHITSNFLKAVFQKFYLVHSWKLCPIPSLRILHTMFWFNMKWKHSWWSAYTELCLITAIK